MDLLCLRRATAAEHASTESSVPLMSGTLTRAEYIAVLRRFYQVVSAWDRWSDEYAPDDLRPLLEGRRRASLLVQDLLALGERVPPLGAGSFARMAASTVHGEPSAVFLGRMYVMEGSTLGGQFIARHVADRLELPAGQGNAFFTGYGAQTATRWNQFKEVLAGLPDTSTEVVIASARNMFALFGEAMREGTGTVDLDVNPSLHVPYQARHDPHQRLSGV